MEGPAITTKRKLRQATLQQLVSGADGPDNEVKVDAVGSEEGKRKKARLTPPREQEAEEAGVGTAQMVWKMKVIC